MPRTAVSRALVAVALVVGAVALAFVLVAPSERCPSPSADALRATVDETVQWFARNQAADGTWLYEYDGDRDVDLGRYNIVRHAGVTMSLFQAAAAGRPDALEVGDRGLAWASEHLVERSDWAALGEGNEASTGATALLTAALLERRDATGDARYDELLARLGRFLAGQVEASGAVLARYDLGAGRPVPHEYSRYYTGEAYWALTRLHEAFPDGGWREPAQRVGAYLATERDDVEDYEFPALPDHWAGYGLSVTAGWPDRPRGRPLTDDEAAYARLQAGLFGTQVRFIAQQAQGFPTGWTRTYVPRGGGYGVVGEALTGLWLAARADERLAGIAGPLAERATCTAGLLVDKQVSADAAADDLAPDRTRGAWFRNGNTRMDDQQHAMSAVLRTIPIVEADDAGGREPQLAAWVVIVVVLAALNPLRAWPALPAGDRTRRERLIVTGLGAGGGGLALLVLAALGGPALDALSISEPSARIAAGVVVAIAGLADLVRRPSRPEPALPGRRAALVPVALPLVARPALVVAALAEGADVGVAAVLVGLVLGVAALVGEAAAGPPPVEGRRRRLVPWAARFVGLVAAAAAVVLVVSGLLDV